MLFNSPDFILVFLPVTLTGFFLIGRVAGHRPAIIWLACASVAFYGYWRLEFLPLLLGSLVFNFLVGRRLARQASTPLLVFGIVTNLALLGWFKYAGFLAESIATLLALDVPIPHIILPLAISFFTFQQIAFLVDAYDGTSEDPDFWRYALFVTFFPHLIAGPLVHHKEMLVQFQRPETSRPQPDRMTLGLTLFLIGLFKKVVLADNLSPVALDVYGPALDGAVPTLVQGWVGALAYMLQLYFDFSGYSDMAVGLGLLFGILLPINFNSPYKAPSIIDYWSRWHMTLTRWITAYIYNPMVLALTKRRLRAGKPLLRRKQASAGAFLVLLAWPTIATMALAGLWHGAGWQFLVFGLLHGLYLTINHGWRSIRQRRGIGAETGRLFRPVGVLLTFFCVTVASVFFKAASVGQAMTMLTGMAGLGPDGSLAELLRLPKLSLILLAGGFAIVWMLPNSVEWLGRDRLGHEPAPVPVPDVPTPRPRWSLGVPRWRPTLAQGIALGVIGCLTLIQALSMNPTEFLYFTF
ncbi:MBOAT family O-acyltransferase [Oleisolibacter albus]|uniref:MBOAT family O-acyltransferase n=1 Tax=Oleisolibacter albus TaxID=2171757 RepID=UPI000DF37253|nr:MBOAT family O-acyltransferase [Oleisolibacter albus]